jgi:hypothetical protein
MRAGVDGEIVARDTVTSEVPIRKNVPTKPWRASAGTALSS